MNIVVKSRSVFIFELISCRPIPIDPVEILRFFVTLADDPVHDVHRFVEILFLSEVQIGKIKFFFDPNVIVEEDTVHAGRDIVLLAAVSARIVDRIRICGSVRFAERRQGMAAVLPDDVARNFFDSVIAQTVEKFFKVTRKERIIFIALFHIVQNSVDHRYLLGIGPQKRRSSVRRQLGKMRRRIPIQIVNLLCVFNRPLRILRGIVDGG